MTDINTLITNLKAIKNSPELSKHLSENKIILENEISCHNRPCEESFKKLLNETMSLIDFLLIVQEG